MYHLLKNYRDKFEFSYFHNINYRGIIRIQVKESFKVDVSYDDLMIIYR